MNWKAIANWALSAGAAFAAGFFAVPLVLGDQPLKVQIMAGVSSGVTSLLTHVRNNPFKLE